MIDKAALTAVQESYRNNAVNFYNSKGPLLSNEIIQNAAKARGLDVSVNNNRTYFFKNEFYIGGLVGVRSSLMSPNVAKKCRQKYHTQVALREKGIPVPHGKLFDDTEFEKALSWVKTLNRRVVVKPVDYEGGKGVTVNVGTATLASAWDHCIGVLKNIKRNKIKILVETYHLGIDVRAIVINKKFVCATTRLPANVIGDGVNTVQSLISNKNKKRSFNPHLVVNPIVVNDYTRFLLEKQLLTLDSIPKKDQVVLLHEVTSIGYSADTVDVTDTVSNELKDLAVRAVHAIPGLDYAGVDIIAATYKNADKAVVNEINTYNTLRMHYYPMMGKARDPGGYLIDYFLEKYKLISHLTLNEINNRFSEAMSEHNVHMAIVYLYHIIDRYTNPPLQLYVKLARLYQEDGNYHMANTILKAAANNNGNEIINDIVLMNLDFQRKVKKLNRQLVRIKKSKSKLENKCAILKKQNVKLNNKCKSIEESRIWRYSEPLRKVTRLIKGIWKSR